MENNKKNEILRSILIIGIFLSLVIFFSFNKQSEVSSKVNMPILDNAHILGNTNSEIFIIEYSDTECPYCKNFHSTMNKIVSQNNNVAWIYKHYPIPELHTKAFREAMATECAFDQGGNEMFWKYINIVFEITPSNDGLEDEELYNIANSLGLEMKTFETCLNDEKYKDKIESDMLEGLDLGVEGTPTSFILKDGKILDIIQGAQPFNIVQDKINKLK